MYISVELCSVYKKMVAKVNSVYFFGCSILDLRDYVYGVRGVIHCAKISLYNISQGFCITYHAKCILVPHKSVVGKISRNELRRGRDTSGPY